MDDIDPRQDTDGGLDRRTVLKRGLIAGGLLTAGGAAIAAAAETTGGGSSPSPAKPRPARPPATSRPGRRRTQPPAHASPNILVIVVDQLRFPQWFSPNPAGLSLPPNLQRLRDGAVSFARHYTASNDCTPARSTLLTGLYTHQTGCMITGGSTLDPGFPTWGTMLREHGYGTWWFGKWHLTHGDNHWTALTGPPALARYDFDGGVYPSPDGGPGQGWRVDPRIAATFAEWFGEEGGAEPWCTAVSFVNPHDIAWWYKWTDRVPPERTAPHVIGRLPPNYETPEQLRARHKPRLQLSFEETTASSFGAVPFTGPEAGEKWFEFLDLYIKLQLEVDHHIGNVLRTLRSRPKVAANTVIVFTSDHGEYGASHGLRGKGASAYEEAIRVPLLVKDPRGVLTSATGQQRTQLTSSVDVAPLLLTIASGSNDWREEPRYAHIAGRADLARILADPAAPGRPYALHATDETVTEYAIEPYAADAPLHIVALRTPGAKYATYSNWGGNGITPVAAGEEVELYDYADTKGRLELHNSAGHSALEAGLRVEHERAFLDELREPLPPRLADAHERGFADYFSTARHVATAAAARRKRRAERELEEGLPPNSLFRRGPHARRLPFRLDPSGPPPKGP
ncbi:MAG TPA: sulfatase-like hydrolase/transferase [Solirubrobacteraceae bacterium]|nr:sulfatase-like hydrolase/transferase [Solirubrobacteraceae bacterium]